MLGAWFIRWLRARLQGDGSCRRAPIRSRRPRFETIERRDLLTTISLAPVADNTLFEAPLGNSDGAGPDIFAGETISDGARRALLRFDVAGSLPAGAHIDSATLQLHVSKDRSSNFSLSVHSLQASWGEGASNAPEPGGRGVPALANDATWTDRFFGTTQKWASSGGDFNAAASATVAAAVTIGGQLFYKWSGDQLAADVQSWLSTPSTQFGWLIKATSESTPGSAQRFDSREGLTPPQLTINYSLPNLAPTLDPIADQTILEGAAVQNINLTNITAGLGETQSLMVTATSDNPTLIATPGVNYTSPNSSGSLSYTPAADRFGSAKVTVTVHDAGADGIFNNSDDATFSQTFTVNVTPVNDPPALVFSDPNAILEDASLQTINLSSISAGPFETQTITITAISDKPGLVPNPIVNYNGTSATGTLTYQPVPNESGKAVITVTVKDDGGTSNHGIDTFVRTFTVNVTPVNDPPTLATIDNPPAILEDEAEHSIELTGISAGPLEAGQLLTITPISSNPGLIANPTAIYNNGDTKATLKYTPEPDQSGIATITVQIKDDGGTANTGNDTVTQTFTIHVTPVNDPPKIDPIDKPAPILENAGQQSISLNNISAGPSETQVITISATSSDRTLIPDPSVNYTSPFIAGSLTYTPAAHRSGVATITVTVKDNGGTASGGIDTTTTTFTVVVTDINDPPTLDTIPNPQEIAENSSEQTIPLTGISAGPFESQFIQITASYANLTLIPSIAVNYTSPDSGGSLTYTPSAGQSGSAIVTLTVRDAGRNGTLNDDDDAVTTQTFTIRVLSPDEINHAPSFVLGILQPVSDQTGTVQPVTDETGPMSQPNFAMQISPGPPSESQQAVSFILTVPIEQRSLFSAQPVVDTTGKLRFIPAPNAHGTAHITIQAKDDGGTALGGVDTSPQQFFDITIIKPHVWHNTRNDRDVDDDHFVVAQDVIAIINHINAKGSGKIPDDATFGPPYYDVDNDGSVVAQDVLNIINFINAGHGGAEEAPSISPAAADAVFQSIGDNLLALTLTDTADSTFLSRRK